jgi:hypothetical protein
MEYCGCVWGVSNKANESGSWNTVSRSLRTLLDSRDWGGQRVGMLADETVPTKSV